MPQLDVVHALTTYLWTWLTLTLITLKIKTFTLATKPKKQPPSISKEMSLPTPWT
uniref:ATP synthase F0 subunit 8 n=1 Tax=Porthidium dunni TaxID=230465 RepID=A0A5B8HVC9_9SAUR|nr:ATP synthase F0 subunit 8 [Porthidium dunni]